MYVYIYRLLIIEALLIAQASCAAYPKEPEAAVKMERSQAGQNPVGCFPMEVLPIFLQTVVTCSGMVHCKVNPLEKNPCKTTVCFFVSLWWLNPIQRVISQKKVKRFSVTKASSSGIGKNQNPT